MIHFKLYYIPTNEMIYQISELYDIAGELTLNYTQLPKVAREHFILEHLVEELYNTNELEGVKSSKMEIASGVRNVHLKSRNKKRFDSMIKLYMKLLFNEVKSPASVNDVRAIYNNITEDEIGKTENKYTPM